MNIILTANTDLGIEDLGIILSTSESINLLENFEVDDLMASEDLSTQQSNYTVVIDSNTVSYDVFIERITKLSKHDHNNLNVLQHNIYEQNHFTVTKESGLSRFITYYEDDTLANKLQEDEIVRDMDGKVSQIITRKFNTDGSIYQQLTQVLNRNTEGKVESISTNTI